MSEGGRFVRSVTRFLIAIIRMTTGQQFKKSVLDIPEISKLLKLRHLKKANPLTAQGGHGGGRSPATRERLTPNIIRGIDMNSDTRRSAIFWKGAGDVPIDIIKKMYGPGPFRGGMSRSEIANRLGINISDVNRVIGKRRIW
jgi:hypothetical protein